MASYYSQPPPQPQSAPYNPQQNLQFYPSSYPNAPVSGHTTPSQAQYGNSYGQPSSTYPSYGGYGAPSGTMGGGSASFGAPSGRMGEQGGLRTGWLAAFGTEGYEGEPPLLEELGVNFGHIKVKTLTVLNPIGRIDQHIMDDSDLAGPVLFFVLFGILLLISGKVSGGYIYGLALVGSVSLHTIFSLMSPPPSSSSPPHSASHSYPGDTGSLASTLTYPRSASVLGYCLLPLVATSAVGVALPMDTPLGYCISSVAIGWCTYSSSGMFCAVGRMSGMRGLVAYPLALFYVGFGIMAIFSSKGASGLAAKVA